MDVWRPLDVGKCFGGASEHLSRTDDETFEKCDRDGECCKVVKSQRINLNCCQAATDKFEMFINHDEEI